MTIVKGRYTVKIQQDAEGSFFALMTYDAHQCVPGVRGKHFETMAKAKAGAAAMFKKVGL